MAFVTLYIATHNKTGLKYFGKTTKWFGEEELQKNYHGSGKYWLRHLKKHGDDVIMKVYGVFDSNVVEKIALDFSQKNDIVNSKEWANLVEENGLIGGASYVMDDNVKSKISAALTGRKIKDEWVQRWKYSMSKEDICGLTGFQRRLLNRNVKSIVMKANKTKLNNIDESGLNINQRNGLRHSKIMKGKHERGEILCHGKYNPIAKKIAIFDNLGFLRYFCHGTFTKICEENNLPFNALKKSYQNNAKPIYSKSKSGPIRSEFFNKYRNWYAREII